jgi:hypothetical protein
MGRANTEKGDLSLRHNNGEPSATAAIRQLSAFAQSTSDEFVMLETSAGYRKMAIDAWCCSF